MFPIPNLPDPLAIELYTTLCVLLPPPSADTEDARIARDKLAMTSLAALLPENAFEANLAADIVAAQAWSKHYLRLAAMPGKPQASVDKCTAKANDLQRSARTSINILLRVQALREKTEAARHPGAMERAGYWFRPATVPGPEPAAQPEPAAAPTAAPARAVADDDRFSRMSAGEQYAVMYPDRAARIRAARGLPAEADFAPPEPEIIDEVAYGTGPILLALDRQQLAMAAA
jgi:hypothetical protein